MRLKQRQKIASSLLDLNLNDPDEEKGIIMKIIARTIVTTLILMFFAAACSQTTPEPTAAVLPTDTSIPTPESVILQYIGHSCFKLTISDGTSIIMDPYQSFNAPREIAQFPAGLSADFVTISHFHPDHSNILGVEGDPKAFIQPGTYQGGSVKVTGYQGDHGLIDNQPTGENTVFVFEAGDIKIVHMGAQGVITQDDILAAIEAADIITFDADSAPEHPVVDMLDQLKEKHVRTIILTHYSFSEDARYYGAPTIDNFLKMLPADQLVVREDSSEISVTKHMPEQVLVLKPLALSMQE
jgi:L-ascorbate metabolism protein UlaG (beta-lactamase superfamily)